MPELFPDLDAGFRLFQRPRTSPLQYVPKLRHRQRWRAVRRSGRAEIRLGSGRDNPRTLGYVARGHQATRASGDWLHPRSAPQISSAVAASATGNTVSFTAFQPKLTNTAPEANEPSAIEPKTRKSLKACTLLRSFGRWKCVTIVVAAIKAKFQRTPSRAGAAKKCQSEIPAIPITAATMMRARPAPVIRSSPKREIRAPVAKLGAYMPSMPSTCHCRPSVA